jgi:signal transduction histidine kinase
MRVEQFKKYSPNLLDQIKFTTILLSTIIIIVVQLVSLLIISQSMGNNLRIEADRVADELAIFLSEPMYNVDDQQTILVADAMLSSGRLVGINLFSAASGRLVSYLNDNESRYIEPIVREISRNGLFLGTVTLYFSDTEIIATRNRFVLIGILVIISVFLVNIVGNRLFLQTQIVSSVKPIIDGISSIRMGKYSTKIPLSRYADVNQLITLLNDMTTSILLTNSALLEANVLLEKRVEERTSELSQSLQDLRQAQDRLVESGKLSALGLMVAGMAHELNTPLGAILSSNRTVMDFFDEKMPGFHDFFTSLTNRELSLYLQILELGAPMSRKLDFLEPNRSRLRKIRESLADQGIQEHRVIADYLAELGIFTIDDVLRSHLYEPRAVFILKYASEILSTRRMTEVVDTAGKKAASVVSALQFYLSHEGEELEKVVSVEEDIEQILILMNNMLKHGITIKREYSGVKTKGSSEKLGQVWMNIIRNAAQAMDYKGTLLIRTITLQSTIMVSFTDTGPGISDDVLPHIFLPFYTTKKHGEGMGLGLDICKRIVESHNGTIEVETKPGETQVRIILPSV